MEIKRTVRFANSPLPTPKGISSESENFLINNSDRAQETVEVKEIESQKDLGYKSLRNNYKVKFRTLLIQVKRKPLQRCFILAYQAIFKIYGRKHSTQQP